MPSMDVIDTAVQDKIDESSREKCSLNPHYLKFFYPDLAVYEDLSREENFILIPLFHVISDDLLFNLGQDSSQYAVSDVNYIGQGRGLKPCNYFQRNRSYELTTNKMPRPGKVLMTVQKEDMNVYPRLCTRGEVDLRRHHWMTRRLEFEGGRPDIKILANCVMARLKQFAKQNELEALIKKAGEELKTIRFPLEASLSRFYFNK